MGIRDGGDRGKSSVLICFFSFFFRMMDGYDRWGLMSAGIVGALDFGVR